VGDTGFYRILVWELLGKRELEYQEGDEDKIKTGGCLSEIGCCDNGRWMEQAQDLKC
jgi:hypothetical protein